MLLPAPQAHSQCRDNSQVKSPHETKFANIPLSIHGTSKSPEKVVMGLILLYIPLIQSTVSVVTFTVQFAIIIQTVGVINQWKNYTLRWAAVTVGQPGLLLLLWSVTGVSYSCIGW